MNSDKKSNKKKLTSTQLVMLMINLCIAGIGIGVLSGSLLKIIPSRDNLKYENLTNPGKKVSTIYDFSPYYSDNEINELSLKWQELHKGYKDLEISGFILHENGKYAQINSNKIHSAASSIKIFILIICLKMLDNQELDWNQKLALNNNVIAGGSGWMRYQPIGKEFPLHEVATEMIRVSDNTATNLLIEAIGGLDVINEHLRNIGLIETQLKNYLPDLEGTNTTTTKELALTLKFVDETTFLSTKARDLFRDILSTSTSNRLIPDGMINGLGINKIKSSDYSLLIKGFKVLNKTGDIGISYSDAAIIQMPNNSNIFAGFIVKGPFNDARSPELIRKMGASIIPFIKDLSQS